MDEIEKAVCEKFGHGSGCSREFLSWFVSFTDPRDTWREQPSYLILQIIVLISVVLNYIHACALGGRYKHWWWATIIVSIVTEMTCYLYPQLNNFWHAQGIVMFAGKRYPLYIVLVYNHMWYPAFIAGTRMKLHWWAEPFAVGMITCLFDLPYDMMGVKMNWWTWHDDDASIYDRHYHVPWTSYYFHSSFCAAMVFIFFGLRKLLMPSKDKFEYGNCILEWICTTVAGVLAMPAGAIFFISIYYNTLHEMFHIHTEVSVFLWFVTIFLIVWMSDRSRSAIRKASPKPSGICSLLPLLCVFMHFLFFILLVPVADPAAVTRTGTSQETGPCNVTEVSFSLTGPVSRRKYLCLKDYDEPFDFHCVDKPPQVGESWYTICGTPFDNHAEYIAYVGFTSVMGFILYYIFLNGGTDVPLKKTNPSYASSQPHVEADKKKQKKAKKVQRE